MHSRVLQTVHDRHSDTTVFVFGHAGEGYPVTGGRAELLVMRDFLGALYEAIAARRAAGETAAQIEGLEVPGFEAWGPAPMRVVEPVLAEIERTP